MAGLAHRQEFPVPPKRGIAGAQGIAGKGLPHGVKIVFVEQYAPARRAHVLQAVDLFRMPAHAADKSGQVTTDRRAVGNRRPCAGIT